MFPIGTILQWFLTLEPIARSIITSSPNTPISTAIQSIGTEASSAVNIVQGLSRILSQASPQVSGIVDILLPHITASDNIAKTVLHGAISIIGALESDQSEILVEKLISVIAPEYSSIAVPIINAILKDPEAKAAIINLLPSISNTPLKSNIHKISSIDPNNPDR